jgi:predicted Zn finger-like uncharacterized protein
MRLTCPNCDAQYEVPDEVMPEAGRDVQCSNCGQTWFQHHPDHAPEEVSDTLGSSAPDPDDEVSPPPPPPPPSAEPKRKQLDPAVADILRQEAEAEQAARRSRQAETLESQPDLGLDDTDFDDAPEDGRSREARARMARLRGEEPPVSDAAATAAALGSRRELLPDIEEINSTLRSNSGGQRSGADGPGPNIEAPAGQREGRGFRSGLLTVAVIALLLALLYIYAPQIAQSVPQVDPYLSGYVTFVDNFRGQLNGQVESLLLWLDNAASQSGS